MKHIRKHPHCALLTLWLISLTLLTSCGGNFLCDVCGKPAYNHVCCPAAPCPVCGADYLCDCAVVETVTRQTPCAICGSVQICDCPQDILDIPDTPPPIELSQAEAGEQIIYSITSGNFSWTTTNDRGVGKTVHACGIRPCSLEMTQRIKLGALEDDGYLLGVTLRGDLIESYTLTAYPVGDYETGTACTLQDGKLALLKGSYYYELIIQYHQGEAVYGFFVE